jgi:HEPN domain-containing protein
MFLNLMHLSQERGLMMEDVKTLLKEASDLKDRGSYKESFATLRRVLQLSFKLVLSRLEIDAPYESTLSLYHLIPIELRPPIGERELEDFEIKYMLSLSSDPLDPRSLEAGLEIAERVVHWADSIMKNKREESLEPKGFSGL